METFEELGKFCVIDMKCHVVRLVYALKTSLGNLSVLNQRGWKSNITTGLRMYIDLNKCRAGNIKFWLPGELRMRPLQTQVGNDCINTGYL